MSEPQEPLSLSGSNAFEFVNDRLSEGPEFQIVFESRTSR